MIETISDKSLKKHTGRAWADWITELNRSGAQGWNHQEIVAFLKKKHKQTAWWQQMIANGYEVATGKRIAGQSLKGTYSATLTKSIYLPSVKIWKWCLSEEGLDTWLNPLSPLALKVGETFEVEGGIFGEIRTIKKGQRVRLTWRDLDWEKGTTVQLFVIPKGKSKSMVVIQHDALPSAALKVQMRAHWRRVIDQMAEALTPETT